MRAFIAIEMPEEVRQQVDAFMKEMKKLDKPVKWVAFENLHITTKFLGEINEEVTGNVIGVIRDVSQRHRSFNVRLHGVGCFPTARNPRVLWVGIDEGGSTVTEIAIDIEEHLHDLAVKREKRFHAHCTVGRIKRPCSVEEIIAREFSGASFRVGALTMFRSTLTPKGPIYEPVEYFPLKV